MSDFVVFSIKDNNIFHILFETIMKYNPDASMVFINDQYIDKQHPCQKWRLFFYNKLYGEMKVQYRTNELSGNSRITHYGYNHTVFLKYELDNHISKIVENVSSKCDGEYILLNQRNIDNRYLYDNNSRLSLEDFLGGVKLKYPLKCVNFETMSPEEQYNACSKAVIFISAHGAGCTNCIFTPLKCPLIEVNFRKHWYCDPVCKSHMNNIISVNEKCDGCLSTYPHFHKADYHNLCYLIGKRYVEIEAVKYGGSFLSENPISKQQIFIDGDELSKIISSLI
jgi:hypothetical protein